MRPLRVRLIVLLASALALGGVQLAGAASATASSRLLSMFEDDLNLRGNPTWTLSNLRFLGAQAVRVGLVWERVAPKPLSRQRPRHFTPSDPASYPAKNWAVFDTIVRDAVADGMRINLDVEGGAPLWATAPGAPAGQPHPNWEPSASEFGAFVHAAAVRYSGHYVPRGSATPLPAVKIWSVWDEPNLGYTLAPQAVPGQNEVENSGRMYRALLDRAWSALRATGHGHDKILIGEIAPRGGNTFGVFNSMKPLLFVRALYCVDSRYHQLRGAAASLRGCPTTAAGSRSFRAAHPALFKAPGFAFHGWMRWYPPNREAQPDPNNSSFALLSQLKAALDGAQRAYGSHRRLPLYNTEFGYLTNPPNHTAPFVSPAKASYYLNWAEYISWKDPRIKSFDNYLLTDPPRTATPYNGWSSGLLTYNRAAKATYSAWRLPLYLPHTTVKHGHSLEVWGCARPAPFAHIDTGLPQTVQIQYQPNSHRPFTTLKTVPVTNPSGYYDVRVVFPASGTVRTTWSYPALDPLLGSLPHSSGAASRSVQISVR